MLASSVKSDGMAIIGLHDDMYINRDVYLKLVSFSVGKAFDNLLSTRTNNIGNRLFINASKPKVIMTDNILNKCKSFKMIQHNRRIKRIKDEVIEVASLIKNTLSQSDFLGC